MNKGRMIRINLVKHLIILFIGLILYPSLFQALEKIKSEQISDFLLIISILLVTVSFANFAFTFEKSNTSSGLEAWISIIATFIYLSLIVFLLESMSIAIKFTYPSLHLLIAFFSIFLYAGIILYDFWDILRIKD